MSQIKIVNLKHRLGSEVITNESLEQKYNLSTGFIFEKTGILKRVKFSKNEDPIMLATELIKEICNENGVTKSIPVFGSANPFGTTSIPSPTHEVAFHAGLRNIPVYHINYGCGGYLGAIDSMINYLKVNPESETFLVLTDHPSSMVNKYQTEILFSDAVHVSLWSNKEERKGLVVKDVFFSTLLENPEALKVIDGFWEMNGRKIVDFAIRVPSLVALSMNLKLDHFFIVPHQPNAKLLETLEKEYSVPFYKDDVVNFGNTTCSAMMIALENVLKKRTLFISKDILLIGFGDTESYGGIIIQR